MVPVVSYIPELAINRVLIKQKYPGIFWNTSGFSFQNNTLNFKEVILKRDFKVPKNFLKSFGLEKNARDK